MSLQPLDPLAAYLQVRSDPEGLSQAADMLKLARSLARLRHWRTWMDRDEFARVFAGQLQISKDLGRRVNGAAGVWLFAVSLGTGVEDRAADMLHSGQTAGGYLLDRVGSYLVEQEIRRIDRAIREEEALAGRRAGTRFSPGYGDIPLEMQAVFVRLASEALPGLHLHEAGILKPEKTVTACKAVWPA